MSPTIRFTVREEQKAKRKRSNHSSRFNAKVAVSTLKRGTTLTELAEQFDVHPNQMTDWKRQLMENANHSFGWGER